MLGRLGMTVDKCIETYRELMGSIFGEKAHWIHVPFNAKANIRPQYDTQKVRSAIEYLLDGLQGMDKDTPFDDGNKDRCKVLVYSMDIRCRITNLQTDLYARCPRRRIWGLGSGATANATKRIFTRPSAKQP